MGKPHRRVEHRFQDIVSASSSPIVMKNIPVNAFEFKLEISSLS